ncbi:hypothetical protein H310_10449 [Aphanomyces invadans]|uniref:Single-strand DNA deaminase toxin A-like C-terminal domain-containing protein n=1 Tax=Aphanomyces invadans TaxID=157072 RepID=A0A024TRM3_9STRA|nr:hypothetical protein H310_10449 [Aphanomyces invadans]ETV96276.1 hypothetical protein H310_10449 [Aphanomyces invadans]|eukprot:XP_008875068.1 hypothetical protein H310_10449 [Aphanomyces invadans]
MTCHSHPSMATASSTAAYYTFAEFLNPSERSTYLTLPHATQIRRFEAYLDFLRSKQVQFPTSKRAATCRAETVEGSVVNDRMQLAQLVAGQTLSGFGVCGTTEGYLPQCDLSMAAAWLADAIGHRYAVENPRVLNSRSFMFCWCHAEKQMLTHLSRHMPHKDRPWHAIRVVVDRDMCSDCIAFASALATHENASICIRDPSCTRVFRPNGHIESS